jgi:hypothetical protein
MNRRRGILLLALALATGLFLGVRAWLPSKPVPGPPQDRPAPPALRFTDVTAPAGITFRHFSGAFGKKLLPETMGAGVAVLDFDADGRPDLLFINSRPWPGQPAPASGTTPALYRNRGDGTFADVTAAAGLDVPLYGQGVAVGDVNNDGFPDVFITAVGGNHLYLNEEAPGGGRRFRDVTVESDVGGPTSWPKLGTEKFLAWKEPITFPSSATFLDYDGDGKLDLFVCYYLTWSPALDLAVNARIGGVRAYVPPTQFEGAFCVLYRNLDGTHFKDVSAEAGVRIGERGRPVGKALGVVVCDPDGDGWPDLAVANDTERNFFLHNVTAPGGGRRFEEIGLKANVAFAEGRARGAMGIDWGEYAPGKDALLIANFANEPDSFLTSAVGPPHFTDRADEVGIAGPSRAPLKFGAFFFDYDLDGRPDLFTCNGHLEPDIARGQPGQTYPQPAQLYRNTGGRFTPVGAEDVGADLFRALVGRGCAYLDFDGDGAPDVVLTENDGPARLLRNDNRLGNKWVRLELVGDGKRSSRDAVGAWVTIDSGGVTRRHYLAGARGYLSQSEHTITVGLGDAVTIDRVTVRWPGRDAGPVQEWKSLEPGHAYELIQGEPATKRRPPPSRTKP